VEWGCVVGVGGCVVSRGGGGGWVVNIYL
jgi:hypothetical protein